MKQTESKVRNKIKYEELNKRERERDKKHFERVRYKKQEIASIWREIVSPFSMSSSDARKAF